MNLHPRQVKQVLIIIPLLFVALTTYFIFGSYLPTKKERKDTALALENEQKLIDILTKRASEMNSGGGTSTFMLQKKVPVKPLLEQFLLDVEKAEVISDSLVKSISIAEGEDLSLPVVEPTTQPTETSEDTNKEETSVTSVIPEGMKRVTLTMQVETDTYENLLNFISTLESGQRLVKVDQLSFQGPEELTSLAANSDDKLTHSIIVSAFYMPNLNDLQDQLPKIDLPEPCKKGNPFVEGVCVEE